MLETEEQRVLINQVSGGSDPKKTVTALSHWKHKLNHTGQTCPHVVSMAHHLDVCDQLRQMTWAPGDQPNSGSVHGG